MAASRSSRVTRSSVGLNGLDENFCGRTLRNRSIAQPEETSVSPLPRARSPKKRQDAKQESRQESKQETRPESKQDTKQESKQESKQDVKQESKQEAKHDTKQDTKQNTRHDGQQQASLQGKETDSNASPAEVEQWTSSRKRGVSCLEKDISPEKPENCDRGKAARDPSPQIKRAKRCSRSGESQGPEEQSEPLRPESPVSVPEPSQDNSCEELLSQNSSHTAPASPVLSREDETLSPGQMEVSGSGESPASSAPPLEAVPEDPISELIVAKQEVEEVEVDVVGETLCLAHEEQVTESDTNGRPPTPVQEAAASTSYTTPNTNNSPINNGNSGETTPPLATTPPPTEPGCNPSISSMPPSFTELYEHRYTLRTSPRRAATGGKATSSKPCSPPRDNGPMREEGEVEVGLEEVCPMVEEPAPSDSVGPFKEEPMSVDPVDRAGGEAGGSLDRKEAESSKDLAQSQAAEEEEEEEEPDVYYFESDHLALKHNKDYQRLLQTIGVLEAQRTQAILDLETLARHQREALGDPISFVEQLQKQVNLGLPCPQRVVQLPDIAWEQYTSGLGDFEREFCDKKRKTRRLKLIFDKGLPLRPKSPVEPKKEGESSTMYSSLPTSDALENERQAQMIRGRICQPNKSDTFNQLWTVEEQKKLEQLLVKFPPEEVESRRWQKIADALGNRTAKQVASRVQKYFIKLTKAGIPVPGRTPNLCMYTKKASSKRQHHLNKHLYRPSTFLTSYEPPVFMDEDDERAAYYGSVQDPSADDSDEESVPVELRNLPEYKELLELKRLKKQKLQEFQEEKVGVRHLGFKCDVCGMEPIQGVRWHCQDCPSDNAVDFCSSCSDCLYKTETHKPTHHLEPVYLSDTFLDRDYCLPQSTGYNYLDPNYFPANR
ncbi:unnamed protein product [Pleuronectes platessa]|uniref:ZZ-type zinc finger-containing protein 3 n=1 Tax=Pleuronectes platessa TaxID=8262 RepID=A0A9N7Y5D8_PLEPL|nr:unnamed protein product [Pleuronectes platessa]